MRENCTSGSEGRAEVAAIWSAASPDPTPAKLANKAVDAAAELVEERRLDKGNTDQQNACRTQSRDVSASSALERVRQVAVKDTDARFTALLHHVDVDRLRDAYRVVLAGLRHIRTLPELDRYPPTPQSKNDEVPADREASCEHAGRCETDPDADPNTHRRHGERRQRVNPNATSPDQDQGARRVSSDQALTAGEVATATGLARPTPQRERVGQAAGRPAEHRVSGAG